MANTVANQMLEDKKKRSPFVQLSDGESIQGQIVAMKQIVKPGYNGEETEVLRTILKCNIEGIGEVEKNFDNGSNKWLTKVVENNLDVGDEIKLTREGEMSKTVYHVEVLSKGGATEVPADDQSGNPKTEEIPF
jgi:hypothetical protein